MSLLRRGPVVRVRCSGLDGLVLYMSLRLFIAPEFMSLNDLDNLHIELQAPRDPLIEEPQKHNYANAIFPDYSKIGVSSNIKEKLELRTLVWNF